MDSGMVIAAGLPVQRRLERRAFVTATGQGALLAPAGGVATLGAMFQATPSIAGVEERVQAIIAAYDAQGNQSTR
jgi:hypothetical protein